MPIVTSRTVIVGRTRLNESMPLINVRDPPYMFRAVTDIRPSADRISTMSPNPSKTLLPACRISEMPVPSNLSPAQPASRAPSSISQPPPMADPR